MTKTDFYRYCRLLHGWLSAIAFIALCFFSLTGLLLNHPDWLAGSERTVDRRSFALTESELSKLRATPEPFAILAAIAEDKIPLKGRIDEGELEGDMAGNELFARARGVRGESFLRANLNSGVLEVTITTPPVLSLLNELHRAEHAGNGWRLVVDVVAVLLIALSIVGYLIFLSMRGARLRTAILLTAASTAGLFAVFAYAVN